MPAHSPYFVALALGLGTGCSGAADSGPDTAPSDTAPATTESPAPDPCDIVEIDYDGPDEPEVGDAWTLFMRCDGALMLGPSVIQFDPVTFASIDENVITFLESGTGLLSMQTGAYQAELEIVVSE